MLGVCLDDIWSVVVEKILSATVRFHVMTVLPNKVNQANKNDDQNMVIRMIEGGGKNET